MNNLYVYAQSFNRKFSQYVVWSAHHVGPKVFKYFGSSSLISHSQSQIWSNDDYNIDNYNNNNYRSQFYVYVHIFLVWPI